MYIDGTQLQCYSTSSGQDKVEVFVDDKRVLVPPSFTVLQVK